MNSGGLTPRSLLTLRLRLCLKALMMFQLVHDVSFCDGGKAIHIQ